MEELAFVLHLLKWKMVKLLPARNNLRIGRSSIIVKNMGVCGSWEPWAHGPLGSAVAPRPARRAGWIFVAPSATGVIAFAAGAREPQQSEASKN